jgi:microcystin-dependent protein
MEPFLGSLLLVPYNFAPRGWMFCQGQTLLISQYTALFSLIGTYFGGDGQTNFKLPNLPVVTSTGGGDLHWVIALQGIFPSRD